MMIRRYAEFVPDFDDSDEFIDDEYKKRAAVAPQQPYYMKRVGFNSWAGKKRRDVEAVDVDADDAIIDLERRAGGGGTQQVFELPPEKKRGFFPWAGKRYIPSPFRNSRHFLRVRDRRRPGYESQSEGDHK